MPNGSQNSPEDTPGAPAGSPEKVEANIDGNYDLELSLSARRVASTSGAGPGEGLEALQAYLKGNPAEQMRVIDTFYTSFMSLAQELRRSAERITIWACGLVLLVVGWLVKRTSAPAGTPSSEGKSSFRVEHSEADVGWFIAGALVILYLVIVAVIETLERRYKNVAYVIHRINTIQAAHAEGMFLSSEPSETSEQGEAEKPGMPKWLKHPVAALRNMIAEKVKFLHWLGKPDEPSARPNVLFPRTWEDFGSKTSPEPIFLWGYILPGIVTGFALFVVWWIYRS